MSAQNSIGDVLRSIEKNNPGLHALSLENDAQMLENRQDLMLDDPEVEFNYLWGQNQGMGNRHDVRVAQSVDLTTVIGMRSKLMSSRNQLSHLQYKAERQNVLLEAKQLCIDIIYYNALINEYEAYLASVEKLADGTARKQELGEASVLEANDARLHYTALKGEVEKARLQRQMLLTRLQSLNGGDAVSLGVNSYADLTGEDVYRLPSSFEEFFESAAESSPALRYVKEQVSTSQMQLNLDKSSWLPSLSVGYMAEITHDEPFRGVTFGVSIPLWRNVNKVRQSQKAYEASRSRQDEAEKEYYYGLLSSYNECCGLRRIAEEYRDILDKTDNRAYYLRAQSLGETSIIEYITELDLYFSSLKETLSAEHDYHQSLASLTSVFL